MEKKVLRLIETPVLLVIFNRPDTTEKVFSAIRSAKPKKLYISADGPRVGNKDDIINCSATREIVKIVDWDCDVQYRFLEHNLGCGPGPSTAISWAFEREERLIILEDDCVPSKSFFDFCNYCLEKYADDTRIWEVSGRSHHENSIYFYGKDYLLSHYGHTWGWATWKRCWDQFDIEMKKLPTFLKKGGAKNVYFSDLEGKFFNRKYKRLFADKNFKSHVWDYQFGFTLMSNSGLTIIPSKNLIQNIGISGTHSSAKSKYHELKSTDIFEINNEPTFVLANREYDLYHFKNHILNIMGIAPLYKRIIKKGLTLMGF